MISAVRIAEGNAKAAKHIEEITSQTDKVLDKAKADAKAEAEIEDLVGKKEEKETKQKSLYETVVKNAIARAKKEKKTVDAVQKVEK